VRFECVAVKESKGGVGFVNEEKNPRASSAPA
jgi:hypothetical protein